MTVMAQNKVGQIAINACVGFSPEFDGDIATIFSPGKMFPIAAYDNAPYLSDDYPPMYNTSSITPNIGVTADYGLLKWLSIGIAGSYQSETINWTPTDFGFNNGQPFSYPYTDKVTRINIAGRILFHLVRSEHFDFYTGFRIGASFWHDVSYSPDTVNSISMAYLKSPAYFIDKANLVVGSFQYLVGLSEYLNSNIGLHLELGFGSPYLAAGGITFRFNTRKRSPDATPNTEPSNKSEQENYGGHQIK